jgi:hypothetical protein
MRVGVGADIWFIFSTAITSAPFQVTVSTPDGQMVSAEFDLTVLAITELDLHATFPD